MVEEVVLYQKVSREFVLYKPFNLNELNYLRKPSLGWIITLFIVNLIIMGIVYNNFYSNDEDK